MGFETPQQPERNEAQDTHILVNNIDDALAFVASFEDSPYPILLIPEGAEARGDSMYVANDAEEVVAYFGDAMKGALKVEDKRVQLISRKGTKLASGKTPIFG